MKSDNKPAVDKPKESVADKSVSDKKVTSSGGDKTQ